MSCEEVGAVVGREVEAGVGGEGVVKEDLPTASTT